MTGFPHNGVHSALTKLEMCNKSRSQSNSTSKNTNIPGSQALVSCLVVSLSRCQLDLLARDLMTDDAPANLFQVAVGADENCLYRAIALLFAGHENCHKQIRLRSFLELMLNYTRCCKERADKVSMESGLFLHYNLLV